MLRDVDAGEFGVGIKVSRKYSGSMDRIRERCSSDGAGQELCQAGLVSVPRPRKWASVGGSTTLTRCPSTCFGLLFAGAKIK